MGKNLAEKENIAALRSYYSCFLHQTLSRLVKQLGMKNTRFIMLTFFEKKTIEEWLTKYPEAKGFPEAFGLCSTGQRSTTES